MTTQIEQIQRACEIIQANPEERHTLGALAGQVGLSRFHFQRAFTEVVGISPRAFAEACRLGQVKRALKKGDRVTPAIYDAGYGSSSRLYERADAALGMTPATYRKGAPGIEIDLREYRRRLCQTAAFIRGVPTLSFDGNRFGR